MKSWHEKKRFLPIFMIFFHMHSYFKIKVWTRLMSLKILLSQINKWLFFCHLYEVNEVQSCLDPIVLQNIFCVLVQQVWKNSKKKSQNFHFWINSLLLIKNHGSMEICISSLLNYRFFRSVYCILYCINRKSEARLDSILFLFPSGAVKLNSCSLWDDSCMTSSQFNFGIVCETKRKTYFNRHCSTTTVVQNRSSSICNIH